MTRIIAPRSQKYFADQWKHIGELNGHVEEMYTGHAIVKAFGHERKSIEKFNAVNDKVYEASWRAQFISGLLFPLMTFINNIGYVAVAVVGGIMVTRSAIAIGDIQAFIQYSRQFTMPIAQTANIANILQSTVASAERVFELLDEKEEVADAAGAAVLASPRGRGAVRERALQLQGGCPAHRGHEPRREAGADHRHRRARRARARPRWSTCSCASTRPRRDGSPWTAWTSATCTAGTSAAPSAWCCRTRGCSTGPSATTSPTAGKE